MLWSTIRVLGLEAFFVGIPALISPEFVTQHAAWFVVAGGTAFFAGVFGPQMIDGLLDSRRLSFEDACRLFRDEVEQSGMQNLAEMLDGFARDAADQAATPSIVKACKPWFVEGLNDGVIEVHARLETGARLSRLGKSQGHSFFGYFRETGLPVLALDDDSGRRWVDMEVSPRQVRRLVLYFRQSGTEAPPRREPPLCL